jgi:hypothetical protein
MVDLDAGIMAREAARNKYKPEKIRWLLIAEAPPDSMDRFFYFDRVMEKDYLCIETMKVLFPGVLKDDFRTRKAQFLQWFKEHGFYLIDVLDCPIYGDTRSRDRKELVLANRNSVLGKLEELNTSITNETRIILIKASVYELNDFLRDAGYNVANSNMIPFPSNGHQVKYREEMAKILGPLYPTANL